MAEFHIGTTMLAELVMHEDGLAMGTLNPSDIDSFYRNGVCVHAAMLAEAIPMLYNMYKPLAKFHSANEHYNYQIIIDGLKRFILQPFVTVLFNGKDGKNIVLGALDYYSEGNVAFGDCLARCIGEKTGDPIAVPGHVGTIDNVDAVNASNACPSETK